MEDILLVNLDRDLRELLVFALRRELLPVQAAHDIQQVLSLVQRERPGLMVLDLDGPPDGFELFARLRRLSNAPIIALSARTDDETEVRAFELGADDYVVKPFSWRVLIARIKGGLRRIEEESSVGGEAFPAPEVLEFGPLHMDVAQHLLTMHGTAIHLTVTEYRLLECFLRHPSVVVTANQLLQHVWGIHDLHAVPLVRAAMFRLRHKLESDPHSPRLLHTVPGIGFMLGASAPAELAQVS